MEYRGVPDAWAAYQAAMGNYAYAPSYQSQQVAPPQPGILEQVLPTATKIGVKELLSSGGAIGGMSSAAPVSSGAVEAALANGIYQTPLNSSMFSTATGIPEATSITNFAGAATPVLGAAGAAAGAYGAYQGIKDKNPLMAALSGGGAGLGLAAMGMGIGPLGWAALIGAPAIGALANKYLDKDEWKTESKKLNKLKKSGVFVPENLLASMPTRGRSKDELINKAYAADFIGRSLQGDWINNKFADSRNEADLRPEDIVGYAAFAEHDKDWFNKPLDVRLGEAKKALDAGAVNEAKGSIKVDWNKVAGALANGK